jgi:hypothetical protein
MKKFIFAVAISIVFSSAAFADVRVETPTPKATGTPKPKTVQISELNIQLSKNDKQARLLIPKSQLKRLLAENGQTDENSNQASSAGFTRIQTIVSGLFLSLAIIFGGVWFARSRSSKTGKNVVAACAVVFLCGACAAIGFANVRPFFETNITGTLFNKEAFKGAPLGVKGDVKIETTDGEEFILFVPRDESTGNGE